MAPYYAVEFPDFWLADQMTSLSGVLLDVEYTLCFFAFDWKQHPGTDTWRHCRGHLHRLHY